MMVVIVISCGNKLYVACGSIFGAARSRLSPRARSRERIRPRTRQRRRTAPSSRRLPCSLSRSRPSVRSRSRRSVPSRDLRSSLLGACVFYAFACRISDVRRSSDIERTTLRVGGAFTYRLARFPALSGAVRRSGALRRIV